MFNIIIKKVRGENSDETADSKEEVETKGHHNRLKEDIDVSMQSSVPEDRELDSTDIIAQE